MHLCSKDPDCILLICFTPSILAQIEIKHLTGLWLDCWKAEKLCWPAYRQLTLFQMVVYKSFKFAFGDILLVTSEHHLDPWSSSQTLPKFSNIICGWMYGTTCTVILFFGSLILGGHHIHRNLIRLSLTAMIAFDSMGSTLYIFLHLYHMVLLSEQCGGLNRQHPQSPEYNEDHALILIP